jgi:uncharacterized protein
LHDNFLRKLSFSGKYTIQFKGLSDGIHPFEFELDNKFFEFFANQDVERGELAAGIKLLKKPGLLEINVNIKGTVNIICDRCLELFDFPVKFKGKLFVKFTQEIDAQDDPDVIFLDPEEHQVDLAQYLYESVILSLPYRKVHPEGKMAKVTCNPEMIEKLKNVVVKENKESDPRWDKLKELKDKN